MMQLGLLEEKERCGNKFIVEKTLANTIEGEVKMREAFHVLGWERVLKLKGEYFPELVMQFYANVDRDKFSWDTLTSFVKGVNVEVSVKTIGEYLRCVSNARELVISRSMPNIKTNWSKEEALARLGIEITRQYEGREQMLVKGLDVRPRLAAYMISFNVDPKASGLNELRVSDLFILDKMFNGLGRIAGIPLAPIILNSMWDVFKHKNVNKNFCFPVLLSRLLVGQGVDVRGEKVLQTKEKDVVTAFTLQDLNLRVINDVWVNPQRQEAARGADNVEGEEQAEMEEEAQEQEDEDEDNEYDPTVLNQIFVSVDELRGDMENMQGEMKGLKDEVHGLRGDLQGLNARWDQMENMFSNFVQSFQPPQ